MSEQIDSIHLNNFYFMFDLRVIIIVISAVKCNITHQFVSIVGYQKNEKSFGL